MGRRETVTIEDYSWMDDDCVDDYEVQDISAPLVVAIAGSAVATAALGTAVYAKMTSEPRAAKSKKD